MTDQSIVRRRKLPHIDIAGKAYFITGCLAGSIPAKGMKRIQEFREHLEAKPKPTSLSDARWKTTKHKLVFKLVDELLDNDSPVESLKDKRLAQLVTNAFVHFADQRYHLLAFVVMPSHHHWLFLPKETWEAELAVRQRGDTRKKTPREVISQSVQSYTATMCNRILNRDGIFWQNETYDHCARDEDELMRILNYIEQNPVKAGLVEQAHQWRWSSAAIRVELGVAAGEPIPRTVLSCLDG